MKKSLLIFTLLLFTMVSKASALPVLWPDNGHYYDFVPFSSTPLTWQEALSSANSLTYMGNNGYLANITSSGENFFINTTFNTNQNDQFAWIAGYEPADDGVWKWASGSESGIQFSNGANPTAPFNFANWGGVEPNDRQSMEDYLMFNIGNSFRGINSGEWADAQPYSSGDNPVVGYLVEFDTPNQTNAVPEPSTLFLLSFSLLTAVGVNIKNREFGRIFSNSN